MPAKTRAALLSEIAGLRRQLRRLENQIARLAAAKPPPRLKPGADGPRPPANGYASLGAVLPQAVFDFGAETVLLTSATGVVRRACAGTRALFGIAPAALAGRLIFDCVAEADRPRFREMFRAAQDEDRVALRAQWVWPTPIAVDSRAWSVTDESDVSWLVGLRAASDGFSLRLATAPELASLFAHELNQPLTALLATVQNCVRLAREQSCDGDLKLAVNQLNLQAERAAELVKGLRDFAKGARAAPASVDLQEIVRTALADLALEIQRHHVEVCLELASAPLLVQGNRTQLGQVVANLLRNAIEAMEETPVRRRRLVIRARSLDREVELEIMDHGKGISVEGVKDLFQPFVSTKAYGTGLGLALTRAIVQAHGGRIWWKDHHGQGASFFVSLPLPTAKDL